MTVPKYSWKSSGCSLQRGVGVEEDDALLLEVLADRVVDDLGLVLRGDTGDQALLLRLGDAELVVGVLDVLGQVVPRGGLLLAGADEVLDVVEVDARQVGAPRRHGLAVEELEALQAQVEHPLRLALLPGDVADDVLAQAALGGRAGVVAVGPAELVAADALELRVALLDGGHRVLRRWRRRVPLRRGPGACGMQVVQTPSPWAMVASRWTWRPSTRPIASVSASHSCGNSWATWDDRAVLLAQLLAGGSVEQRQRRTDAA